MTGHDFCGGFVENVGIGLTGLLAAVDQDQRLEPHPRDAVRTGGKLQGPHPSLPGEERPAAKVRLLGRGERFTEACAWA